MDIPVKAQVECLGSIGGQSTCIIINPTAQFVTHVVVEDKDKPNAQYLVPLAEIKLSTPHLIQLRCTTYELQQMPRFVRVDYERRSAPYTFYSSGDYLVGPTVVMEDSLVPIPHLQVPEDELAVREGAPVRARDGYVGQVDEFLIDPTTTQIERIADNPVYLKCDKRAIEQMQNSSAPSKGQ